MGHDTQQDSNTVVTMVTNGLMSWEMQCIMGKKTEKYLNVFFLSLTDRNDYGVTVRLWRPCWIEIISKIMLNGQRK